MTEEQCNKFRNNSYVNLALTLREFEDLSKKNKKDIIYSDIDYVEKLLKKYVK